MHTKRKIANDESSSSSSCQSKKLLAADAQEDEDEEELEREQKARRERVSPSPKTLERRALAAYPPLWFSFHVEGGRAAATYDEAPRNHAAGQT
jgi:hypothetical protein